MHDHAVRWAWSASKRPRLSSLQSGLAPELLCYRQLHAVKTYVHDIHHYMHCIISLFWFLNNHVTSPAEGLHFSALVFTLRLLNHSVSTFLFPCGCETKTAKDIA